MYWHGWELLGQRSALDVDPARDSTAASNVLSWYGPVGLVAACGALCLVAVAVWRRTLPTVAIVLATAPIAFLLGTAVGVTYFDLNGRFVMGGVALSAATWGLLLPLRALAVALVAVAATTVVLVFVHSVERPAGIGLIASTGRPSVWTLPREWSQSLQPEVAVQIGYVDRHALDGSTVAVSRDAFYPFAYAGYPQLRRRIVYADTLGEASARRADWAVVRLSKCVDGWKLVFRSPPWGVYRAVTGASCDAPAADAGG